MQEIREKARAHPAKILFPEGEEPRVRKAIEELLKEKLAEPAILIRQEAINSLPCETIVVDSDLVDYYATKYWELRRKKGISIEIARKVVANNLTFIAALMVREGKYDGFIAGASYTTKNVAKAVIHCLPLKKQRKYVASCMVIMTDKKYYGYDGKFIFSDCGVIIEPSPEQLKEIAIESANVMKRIFSTEPKVALLSYSTHGSADGKSVLKIREAINLIKAEEPNLKVDGELQFDSAIDAEVAKKKIRRESLVAGKANVLIFPDLNAGNISYKIVQRLCGARALGPIFLSLRNPCSDLSRGCDYQDIVDTAAILSASLKCGL